MANIKNELNNIKNALYGKDVRGSIHDGIDAINKEVENTTGRQVDLENTFDQLIINAGNSNAEIVDARVGQDGKSYSKLGDRLDDFTSQLAHIKNIQVNVKDFGAVGDGITDDSLAIISALNTIENGGTLVFPEGHYMIDSVKYKIRPKSNQIFQGTGKSVIQSMHTKSYYHIFDVVNVSNVIIENLFLIGDKDAQSEDTPVIGMGIAITGSNNITIRNCDISKMWGDGIVLGGYRGTGNKNINILNTISHDNARQGLSLTFGEDITIKDSKFNDTDVLLPSCGIDIEPNEGEYVKNVVIDNVECNNNREGLAVFCYSSDIENLSINNANILKNREYGLTLAHTDRVSINNCVIEENGDIGCNFSSNNKNVTVNNLVSKNNGKHGLRLTTIGDGDISAKRATKNITFNSCKFNNNSKKENGYDGLKIELNHSSHKIENIKFIDCEFNDNQDIKTQNIGLNIEKSLNIKNVILDNIYSEGNIEKNLSLNNSNMVYSSYKKNFEVLGEKIIVKNIDYSTSTFITDSNIPDNNTRLFVSLSSKEESFPTKKCIPNGLSLNTSGYYLIKVSDNSFKLSTTSNGTSIEISDTGLVNFSQFHFEYSLSGVTFDFSNIGSKNITIEVDGKSPVLSAYGYLQINKDISTDSIFYDIDTQQKTRPLLCGGALGIGNILSKMKINISCEHYLIVNIECFGIVANDLKDNNEVILSKKTYYTDKVKNTLINSVTFRSCELSIGTKVIVS